MLVGLRCKMTNRGGRGGQRREEERIRSDHQICPACG